VLRHKFINYKRSLTTK